MSLQGINEIFGGIKDKRQGKSDLANIEANRGALTPKISTIASENLLNSYDKSMVNMMKNSQAQRQANVIGASGRNPLAMAKVSSASTDAGLKSDMELLKFMDGKKSGARETFRTEEVSVMDKKWNDFLGQRGEAKNLIQQGKQRASQGLGAIDDTAMSIMTMGMGGMPSGGGDKEDGFNNMNERPGWTGGDRNEVPWDPSLTLDENIANGYKY